MVQVNMLEAKTDLSKLVRQLECHEQDIVYIARNGQPVVQMQLIDIPLKNERVGVAKGKLSLPKEFDEWDDEVAEMFGDTL